MSKPRRFTHSYIYVDERKERLKKMKDDVRQSLNKSSLSDSSSKSVRDVLLRQTADWHRYRRRAHRPIRNGVLWVAIIALFFFLYVMIDGLM